MNKKTIPIELIASCIIGIILTVSFKLVTSEYQKEKLKLEEMRTTIKISGTNICTQHENYNGPQETMIKATQVDCEQHKSIIGGFDNIDEPILVDGIYTLVQSVKKSTKVIDKATHPDFMDDPVPIVTEVIEISRSSATRVGKYYLPKQNVCVNFNGTVFERAECRKSAI